MANTGNRRNNPYIIGIPIDELKMFFGRESLFHFIEDNLNQNVKVILLHGQRRIGKSSVLKKIANSVAQEGFVFVTFDLHDKRQSNLSEILHKLATEIVERIELDEDRFKLPTITQLKNEPDIFSREVLPKVYRELGGKNLVLLLDEFDVMSDDKPDILAHGWGFFPYLERLLRQQEKLFIIPVVGRNLSDMPQLRSVFKSAPTQEIGLLDELSTQRLITKPAQGVLEYESDAIKAILELSAGHPFFTQVICFTLFGQAREKKNWTVTRANVENVVEKAIENAGAGLPWFWQGLPIPEQVVLSAVAEAQSKAIKTDQRVPEEPLTLLKSYGVLQTKPLIEGAKQLAEKGFLDDTERRVKIELVRRWLVQDHPLSQEIKELEKIDQEEVNRLREEASGLLKQGKKQKALDIYERVLALNPNHFSTLPALAEGYLEVKDFAKAAELYSRAYQVNPIRNKEGFLRSLLSYGSELITQKEFTRAKEQCNRVLEIQPDNVSAQQKLREIKVFERVSTWTCEGYRDDPHSPVTIEINQICPSCSRAVNSSNYSSQYKRKRIPFVGAIAAVAGIVALFGVYRVLTPCPVGQQKVLGISCVAEPISRGERKISRGEFTLFPNIDPNIDKLNRNRGIEAFRKGNYIDAAELFKKAVADNRNDPEVLIYYNNARAHQKSSPLTLAVVVPVDNKADSAQEMLRGVAQAQNQFNDNGGLDGQLLKIAIANDGNEPDKAKKVAEELVNDPSVLGVIGHNDSNATEAALAEYKKADLAMISPTSTSTQLTGDVFFRTVPSDAEAGKELAKYAKDSLKLNKVVIFYNDDSDYSDSLREEFTKNFELLGGKVVRKLNLADPELDVEQEVPQSIWQLRYQAEAALLFPNAAYTSVALEIAQANVDHMSNNRRKRGLKLLGGDALYSEDTLTEGGKAVEGLVLAVPWFAKTPKSQNFSQAAEQRWGGQVSWRTATSFDATQAYIEVLSPNPSRKTILQRLRQVNLSPSKTSGEALQFTQDGERTSKPILVKVAGGNFESVEGQK